LSRSFRPLLVVLVALAFLAAACGDDDSEDDYGVRSHVVGDENTQDILVFEPDAEAPGRSSWRSTASTAVPTTWQRSASA
jgi:hypothetical protein